jgi:hypothetical protein
MRYVHLLLLILLPLAWGLLVEFGFELWRRGRANGRSGAAPPPQTPDDWMI